MLAADILYAYQYIRGECGRPNIADPCGGISLGCLGICSQSTFNADALYKLHKASHDDLLSL